MPDKLQNKLKKATKGLMYPSEYDAPVEPFVWEQADNNLKEVRRLSGQPTKDRGRVAAADDFFRELEEVEGFDKLYQVLKEVLSDLQVYTFGDANITIYLVGRDENKRLAGVKTTAVET